MTGFCSTHPAFPAGQTDGHGRPRFRQIFAPTSLLLTWLSLASFSRADELITRDQSANDPPTVPDRLTLVPICSVSCGPCHRFKSDRITKTPGSLYHTLYRRHRLKKTVYAETELGRAFVSHYSVNSFPTFLLLDGNRKEVTRIVGYDGPKSLLAGLRAAEKSRTGS